MKRTRIAVLAGSLALLTAAGAGIAIAATTGPLSLGVTASGATPGVSATSDAGALNFTYDEVQEAFATAGAVTIQNTGTREASYHLTVTPHDATTPAMPAQISIAIGTVADTAACTPTATLGAAQTGTLASAFAFDSGSATVAPGASVVLCVRTAFDEGTIGSFGETSVALDIGAALVFAPGEVWTVTSATTTVTQDVVSADLWLLNAYPIARYWVDQVYLDGNDQLQTYGRVCKDGSIPRPVRFTGVNACTDAWNSQWRLVPVPDSNAWWILAAVDTFDQPTTPRWTYAGAGTPIVNAAPSDTDPNQQWVLKGNGDGSYRIVSVGASTGSDVCLTTGGPGNAGGTLLMVPATCDSNSTTQAFTFTMNGIPHPGVILDGNGHQVYPNGYPLTCSGSDTYNRKLTWPTASSYGGETYYRVMINGVEALLHTNGHSTAIEAGQGQSWLQDWWAANAAGQFRSDVTMVIEQRITSLSSWIPVTEPRPVTILHMGNGANQVYCSGAPEVIPANPQFTCTNGPGNYWNWQLANGTAIVTETYRGIATYRAKMGDDVFAGPSGGGYNYNFGFAPASNQAFYAAHQGSQVLTVEYSLDGGVSWNPLATKTVTIADPGGSPAGYRVMSGC